MQLVAGLCVHKGADHAGFLSDTVALHGRVQASGRVTYNGRALGEFLPERTAVYVEQEDQHMPELTVRETFNFSARCQGAGSNAGAARTGPPLFACRVQLGFSGVFIYLGFPGMET